MKVRKEHLNYPYLAILAIFLVLFLTGTASSITGYQLVVIDNADPNSMYPTYFQGDQFIIQKTHPMEIEIGDVIVYKNSNDINVIHRIIDIQILSSHYYFRVKGDNPITNPPDIDGGHSLINSEAVLGTIVYRIPFLCHISLALQRNFGVKLIVFSFVALISLATFLFPNKMLRTEILNQIILRLIVNNFGSLSILYGAHLSKCCKKDATSQAVVVS